jgi:hypothetical protein
MSVLLPRRGFLFGVTTLIVAPSVVRSTSLMPIKPAALAVFPTSEPERELEIICSYPYKRWKPWQPNPSLITQILAGSNIRTTPSSGEWCESGSQ